jgi:hypothetical protein
VRPSFSFRFFSDLSLFFAGERERPWVRRKIRAAQRQRKKEGSVLEARRR